MALKVVNIYDSFQPNRLLEVRFELSDLPQQIRTFRSSYSALYSLMYHVEREQIKINGVHKGLKDNLKFFHD